MTLTNSKTPSSKAFESFVIGNRALCFWDADIHEVNVSFIQSIDPEYFSSLAELYSSILDGGKGETEISRQHAAVAVRMAHSQALEAFFSLLFASVQAPRCVFGWLSSCSNKELSQCVNEIQSGRNILTRFDGEYGSWEALAELTHYPLLTKEANGIDIIENFALLWTRLASDFTNDLFAKEYNCIKHGLRVRMGDTLQRLAYSPM